MSDTLKAPFPWFGGKSRVASLVWDRLGDVDNFLEPFMGSAAVLLARPHAPRVETVNDLDCYVSNFWRATQADPEAVAEYADWPVNEADLHSRHRWLVLSDEAKAFRQQMRTDPEYYDCRVAGWWVWGLCCWIGGGWCAAPKEGQEDIADGRSVNIHEGVRAGQGVHHPAPPGLREGRPHITGSKKGQHYGNGVHGKGQTLRQKRPRAPGDYGTSPGVHAKPPAEWQQVPTISNPGTGEHQSPDLSQQVPMMSAPGRGVHASSGLSQQVPNSDSRGVLGTPREGRPQLADQYARGRGVHGHDLAGTCAARRAWLIDWFSRLRDRLRTVRVCCGHWARICSSDSVTTRLGVTGVFLDPPYGRGAGRDPGLYATDSLEVAAEVREWCLARGTDRMMRIALCGYAGEGHETLEGHGWKVEWWKAAGGYGNASAKGKANSARERIWFSPHCHNQRTLFDNLE